MRTYGVSAATTLRLAATGSVSRIPKGHCAARNLSGRAVGAVGMRRCKGGEILPKPPCAQIVPRPHSLPLRIDRAGPRQKALRLCQLRQMGVIFGGHRIQQIRI